MWSDNDIQNLILIPCTIEVALDSSQRGLAFIGQNPPQALHQLSHTRHSHQAGSGVACVMYTLEGTKHNSGLAGNFARNGRRTALSPNDQLFCPHDLPANIVSNVKHVSVAPVRHCVKSK